MSMQFDPVLRFIVTSDIHYKVGVDTEVERFEKGMKMAFDYAAGKAYDKIDALYVVGDFANSGSEDEMKLFSSSLKNTIPADVPAVLMMASHEYKSGGEQPAHERFASIFGQSPDQHKVINGFHFISITTENGCRIGEEKAAWLSAQLKVAADDDFKKPIFVFQHPHLSDTVYGSINWGEDDIISVLADYPQVVDFSGHSHAPVNDPRSIHQKLFSCFGTGSFSYFELDEFDKMYGTVPPDAGQCAQYLIVEADADNRVRVIPVDVLSGKFFNDGALIEKPWDPDSFVYTDERYRTAEKPCFDASAVVSASVNDGVVSVTFPQAFAGKERSDGYIIVIRDKTNSRILAQKAVFSSYYLYDMPEEMSVSFELPLSEGEYLCEVTAQGFWRNYSDKLISSFRVSK